MAAAALEALTHAEAPGPRAGSIDPRNTLEFRELRGSWILRC